MKKVLLVLFVSYIGLTSYSQNETVAIPDVNFLNALIEEGVDSNKDGIIQKNEAEDRKRKLSLNAKSITNLTGIEAFVNLGSLECPRFKS